MRRIAIWTLALLTLSLWACEDDPADDDASGGGSGGAIAVLTRVRTPDADLHYLQVFSTLPADRKLDRSKAVEFGDVQGAVWNGAIYIFDRTNGDIQRWRVNGDLELSHDGTLALSGIGVTSPAVPLAAWSSPTRAHLWDYSTGTFITWNPETMELVSHVTVPEATLTRNGVLGDLEWPQVVGGKVIYNIAWFDWDNLQIKSDKVSVAWFDAAAATPEMHLLDSDRCAFNGAIQPFGDAAGNVYVVGDAVFGLLNVGAVTPVAPNACVVRIKPDFSGFDPDFYVDLLAKTGARGVYGGYPVGDGKHLIVNDWAPDVEPPATSDDYWSAQAWKFDIVDVSGGATVPVPGIPRGGAANLTALSLDGVNMVQVYAQAAGGADREATLYAVRPDGSATPVLAAGSAGDFEMIGRVR